MRSLVLLLVLGGALAAAPPAFELPAEVKAAPGEFVVVAPKTDAKTVTWKALTPGLSVFPSSELRDPRRTVVLAPRPGRYTLYGVASLNDEHAAGEVVLVVGDGKADPAPGPQPTPPVPPGPLPPPVKVKKLALAVIEESSRRTPQTAAVVGDLNYWNGLRAKGHAWGRYDPDQPEAAGYAALLGDVKAPAVLVMALEDGPHGKAGTKLKAVPLPASTAGVDELVKSLTGE